MEYLCGELVRMFLLFSVFLLLRFDVGCSFCVGLFGVVVFCDCHLRWLCGILVAGCSEWGGVFGGYIDWCVP